MTAQTASFSSIQNSVIEYLVPLKNWTKKGKKNEKLNCGHTTNGGNTTNFPPEWRIIPQK